MSLLLVFLLAIGLCFDSFAVSIGTGTICERFSWRSIRFAVILGVMQALMPFIGWIAIGEFHSHVAVIDHWIAFVLLAFLGGKMIVSGISAKKEKPDCNPLSLSKALLMGLATSIDALIAGVALALVKIDIVEGSQLINMMIVLVVIFFVTFLASAIGLLIGRGIGSKIGARAEIIGGVILVLIGTKVLIEHLQHDHQLSCIETKTEAKVICFNIRYENTFDQNHVWGNRRDAILRMIDHENPEFLGVQEALNSQILYLDSALTHYTYIGVGRDNGIDQGEYAAIFFDTTRVVKLDDGNFWLCPTPSIPALGWDAVCVRMATWGKFALKTDPNNQFFVVNTHFDHVGIEARTRSGELIINTVDSIGGNSPMILMGDFNCTIADESLAPILSKMADSRPDTTTAVPHTFIGFGNPSDEAAVIDHIFTRGMKTDNYRVITDNYNAPYGQLSDHLPLVVNFSIKP